MEDKYQYKKTDDVGQEVELQLPSGNFILMGKPSKHALMFAFQALPSAISAQAIEKWNEQGVGNEQAAEELFKSTTPEERLKALRFNLKIRDKVLELSRKPKLVLMQAEAPGELSVDDMSGDDLDYLFQWVASGGVAPSLLNFPRKSKPDTLASATRKTKRTAAVAGGGAEG
jgi:hypothetical protein